MKARFSAKATIGGAKARTIERELHDVLEDGKPHAIFQDLASVKQLRATRGRWSRPPMALAAA
jgi:hypothetical protein